MKTFCTKQSFIHVLEARRFKIIDEKHVFDDTGRRFNFSGDHLERKTNQDYDKDIKGESAISFPGRNMF